VLFIVFAFSFFNYLLPAGSGPFALAVLALLLLGYLECHGFAGHGET
jgi:hypothetical protein